MKRESTLCEQNIVSDIQLIPLNKLKPIEKVFRNHLNHISDQINKDGCINQPLIIDKTDHIILDGSHRYAYLKANGFTLVPVIMVDYSSSLISVGSNLTHRFINTHKTTITKQDVINKALNNELFTPRQTRHFFPFRKEEHPVKLEYLKKSESINIDYLISSDDISKQIKHNSNYIKEIDTELELLNKYVQEQLRVKEYLHNQIINMQKEII